MKHVPRVLIVDDEPDVLLLLRIELEAEGYETLLAADGETAIRRIVEEKPEVKSIHEVADFIRLSSFRMRSAWAWFPMWSARMNV